MSESTFITPKPSCPYCPYVDEAGKTHDPLSTQVERTIHAETHAYEQGRQDRSPRPGCKCEWCSTGTTCDCGSTKTHYPHDAEIDAIEAALWVAHKYIYEQLNDVEPRSPILRTTLLALCRNPSSERPRFQSAEDSARDWLHIYHGEERV